MSFSLGGGNDFVLNKQPPNQQIWLSSPLRYECPSACAISVDREWSGPKRYTWDENTTAWVNTRDRHCLVGLLNKEIQEITGHDLQLSPERVFRLIDL